MLGEGALELLHYNQVVDDVSENVSLSVTNNLARLYAREYDALG